jgi:hypothetical protein
MMQIKKKYNNLDNVRKDLEKGFKYVKYYYPSFKTPAVVASVESFNPDDPNLVYGTVFYHDTLIIRLQMFMGKDFDEYDPNIYPDYLRRRFNEDEDFFSAAKLSYWQFRRECNKNYRWH